MLKTNIKNTERTTLNKLLGCDIDGIEVNVNCLKIPEYQRNYMWDKSQVEQLYDDFENHHKSLKETGNNTEDNETKRYYLGSFVVVDGRSLDILDGQQRITTLLIFNSVLDYNYRNLLKEIKTLNEELISAADKTRFEIEVEENIKALRNIRWAGERPRLIIKYDSDKKHFEYIMQNDFDIKANIPNELDLNKTDRMFKTFGILNSKITNSWQELSQNDGDSNHLEVVKSKKDTLDAAYNYLVEGHSEASIIILAKGREFEIFETLNNRGKELNSFDLTRNVMIHASSRCNDQGLREDIIDLFDESIKKNCRKGNSTRYDKNATDFILYSWLIRSEKKVTKKQYMGIFLNFSKDVENGGFNVRGDVNEKENLKVHKKFLLKTSSSFFRLLNPNKIITDTGNTTELKALKERVFSFNLTGFKQYFPIYIALSYQNINTSSKIKWISLVEKIYVNGYILYGISPSKYEEMLHKSANEIFKLHDSPQGDPNYTELNKLYESLKTSFYSTIDELSEKTKPTEERQENYKEKFIEKFSNLKLGQNNRIQYLLRNIENHLRDDNTTLLDDELTLEHVLPASYRAYWGDVNFKEIDAGDQAGPQPRKLNYKHDGQTLHDAYVDRIGNHTLLASSDNTSISNLDFETKKRDCFESASLNITKNMHNNSERKNISLCNYNEWNSTSIEKRSKALATIAFEIWGFNINQSH